MFETLKYSFVDKKGPTTVASVDYIFSPWAASHETLVETKVIIFPFTSLVAEFRGVLGLFL